VLHATIGLPFGALLALVFLGGLLDPPGDTAKTSMTPDLAALARTSIERAAGAQSAVERSAMMLGAGAAGALVAFLGPMPALLVDAGGFLVSALLVLCFVPRRRAASAEVADQGEGDAAAAAAARGGFLDGLRFVASTPLLRSIVVLVTLTNAIDAAGMTVLKPVYATEVLGDPAQLGFMFGCFAAGALTGSVLFGVIGHRFSGRFMFAGCFIVAGTVPYLTMALDAPSPVLLPVLVLSGLAAGAINPMITTVMYAQVPDGMRARVFGATTAGVAASMPLGALLGGLAVEQLGLTPTLVACGVLYVVLGASPLLIRSFSGLEAARPQVRNEA